MLIWIAIGNAVLWSGVILFLLLWLMRDAREIEERLSRMESKFDEREEDS